MSSVCLSQNLCVFFCQERGRPLPKFGEWDVNDPASAEGFTVIFNKARDEKKTGGKPDSPGKVDTPARSSDAGKPPAIFLHYRRNGCAVSRVPLLTTDKDPGMKGFQNHGFLSCPNPTVFSLKKFVKLPMLL
ncbi:hypothetical protein SAY87_004082 [Trapa incisa]|uniref:RIN4 pathogenic type III effector avirulence factor Avr cleavage site domain-containing protein n=1 Tax=Trapa incisa TaxID=236973 RepID=A0AAN7JNC4_9MYRT|nr:hypothetical protein SAY87_004082 [Trapa incisa]